LTQQPKKPRLLILGGTTEATALAQYLSRQPTINAIISLAGRTNSPVTPAIPHRIGGFGGIDGLGDYLVQEGITAVIDATHPFAAIMSRHAFEACRHLNIPRLTFTRPPWNASAYDHWTSVATADAAADAIGATPQNVFLTVGRLSVASFMRAPQHRYLIRTIDTPDTETLPPHAKLVHARGPFTLDDERHLFKAEKIAVLVTKNSGGTATDAKLLAAREMGVPVIMVDRPPHPDGPCSYSLEETIVWLKAHGLSP
jgi:precorrin-6A/cobalt-precorrin-6A reductase